MDYISILKDFMPLLLTSSLTYVLTYLFTIRKFIKINQDLQEQIQNSNKGEYSKYFTLAGEVVKSSPLYLTDQGELVLYRSGGKDYIQENLPELFEKIKSQNPKTAYDVHMCSISVLKSQSYHDSFNSIKTYAFNTGMDLDIIIGIMSISLRDSALRNVPLSYLTIKNVT